MNNRDTIDNSSVTNNNWFSRTALQVGVLSAGIFGAYKMKGPASNLANKYIRKYQEKIANREAWKQLDSQDRMLGPHANIRQPDFGINFDDPEFIQRFPNKETFVIETDPSHVLNIENSENSLVQSIETDIGNEAIINKDEMLFKLRRDTLYEYINTHSLLRDQDRKELQTIKEFKDSDRLIALHKYYIEHDKGYYRKYNQRLSGIKNNYRTSVNRLLSTDKAIRPKITSELIQNFLYGTGDFDFTPESAATLRYQAGRLAKDRIRNIDVYELLKTGEKVTSGSLSKVDITLDKKMLMLGQFDYTQKLKKISNIIQSIKNGERGESMIKNISCSIVSEHTMSDSDRWFLEVNFSHKIKGNATIRIPLAQHGKLPGGSPGTTEYLDGFYLKRSELFNPFKKDLAINMQLENKTQQMLDAFYDILDSNMLENDFSLDPGHFARRAQSTLNKILDEAPRAEGTTRDYFKNLRVVLPKLMTKKSRYLNDKFKTVVRSGKALENFSNAMKDRSDILNITLDFETIGRDLAGPQWMARDEFTEITKAGLVSTEYSNGKAVSTKMREFVSDHGIKSFDLWYEKKSTIGWLRKEVENSQDMTDSQVVENWKRQLTQDAERSVQRNGVRFKNNQDFIENIADSLLSKIKQAVKNRKKIFITTKNGSEFDLHLIQKYAPNQWAELTKYSQFIDTQSIAYTQKLKGQEGSLALSKIIIRMMNLHGASSDDIYEVRHGNLTRAIQFFRSRGLSDIDDRTMNHYLQRGIIGRAHTPVADCLATNILLIDAYKNLFKNPDSYKMFSDIEKMLIRGDGILGLDESFEEARAQEQNYRIRIPGTNDYWVLSSSMLSHSQQAKNVMSMISPNHLIPFSDNAMSKQWDQFFAGVKVRASDFWLNRKSNISNKQLYNKYFKGVFVSKGEINAGYKLNSDAMTNYFQHHIVTDTIYQFNSWMGQEGYNAFSEEALKRYQIHFTDMVDLNKVTSKTNDAILNNRLIDFKDKIWAKAKELADVDHGRITSKHLNVASRMVLEEMDSNGLTIINPGDYHFTLSHGDAGVETVKREIGGKIVNVVVNMENEKLQIHAELAYAANGPELKDIVSRYRSLGSKSMLTVDNYNSLLLSTGAEHIANADFFEKGYVGAQKQLITEKVMQRLFDTYENGTDTEKRHAHAAMMRLARDVKSDIDFHNRTFIHDPDAPTTFKHISDPEKIAQARKYYGNIDMNFEKLNSHMVDAGIVWTEEKYRQWLGMWGGKDKIQSWINDGIKKHTEAITKQSDGTFRTLTQLEKEATADYSVHLQKWFLPKMEDVKAGKAAMYWEPFQKDPSTFVPGFRVLERGAIYGMMKGGQAKMTNLKLRGNLFHFLNLPFSHVTESTLKDLRSSKRAYNGDRYSSAMGALKRFKDALMSTANLEDLNLQDIQKLLDNKGSLDTKALARWVFTDGDKAKVIAKLSEYMTMFGEKSEDQKVVIDKIIAEMQANKLETAFEKESNMISVQAVEENWENLAKKKGVFAYSKRKELGGGFTFHIRDLLRDTPGFNEKELISAENQLLNTFEYIYKSAPKEGIVESFDRKGGVVKLRKLIMHADTSKENIFNVLNPNAQEKTFGFQSITTRYQKHVIKAMENYEREIARVPTGNHRIGEQEAFLKKQYLNYLLKGFLMDSSSVYAQAANELSPRGMQAHIIGAAPLTERAADIKRLGGLKKAYGFTGDETKFDSIINRLAGTISDPNRMTNLSDIYMTASMFKQMEFSDGVKATDHLEKIFGREKARMIANGLADQPLYGYMTRHPNMQAGYDAILDNRLNIIPDELAPYLGMNSNEVNVHNIYTKLFGADFDGDQAYFVLKSLKTSETLMDYHKSHLEALQKSLESFTTKGGEVVSLREAAGKNFIRDISNGKINVSRWDEKGNLIQDSIDINNQEATGLITDLFKTYAKNAHTLELNSLQKATWESTQKQLDQVAATIVSKNNIGLFTNIAYKRSRQLMQVGLAGKDSLAAKLLIGNLSTGDAGIAQLFISLGKHEQNVKQLAEAAKAYINPFIKDDNAHEQLKNLFKQLTPKGQESKAETYYKTWRESIRTYNLYTPRDELSISSIKALEDIDLFRDSANIMHAVVSQAQVDFIQDYGNQVRQEYRAPISEFGETLSKHLKLDSGIRANFKKAGKAGAIGAAIYLAANFFRPNQLSSSINPLDAFTDLGSDINGRHNIISSNLELDRSIPLDMVNASFSKKAYVRLNEMTSGKVNKEKSNIINQILSEGYKNTNPLLAEWRMPFKSNYTNYTQNINYFGSSQLDRRSKY